eukprot:CAMPEP_0198233404 /NCGR_PEP_ID=MMETSP1445-20131203/116222_1 /TAXON_ID=36898 /ORGANISM="Pyramimonas sp., Strain CCMP2087" /LENGTH=502 /DNA_ID=CAMNT_0043914097 /DNA_START=466 /DNA_END=1971 /DNA_ORIENTATION=-
MLKAVSSVVGWVQGARRLLVRRGGGSRKENGDEPKVGVAGEEIEPRRLDFNVAHHPKDGQTPSAFNRNPLSRRDNELPIALSQNKGKRKLHDAAPGLPQGGEQQQERSQNADGSRPGKLSRRQEEDQSKSVFQTWRTASHNQPQPSGFRDPSAASTSTASHSAAPPLSDGGKRKRNLLKHVLVDVHENAKRSRQEVRFYFSKQSLDAAHDGNEGVIPAALPKPKEPIRRGIKPKFSRAKLSCWAAPRQVLQWEGGAFTLNFGEVPSDSNTEQAALLALPSVAAASAPSTAGGFTFGTPAPEPAGDTTAPPSLLEAALNDLSKQDKNGSAKKEKRRTSDTPSSPTPAITFGGLEGTPSAAPSAIPGASIAAAGGAGFSFGGSAPAPIAAAGVTGFSFGGAAPVSSTQDSLVLQELPKPKDEDSPAKNEKPPTAPTPASTPPVTFGGLESTTSAAPSTIPSTTSATAGAAGFSFGASAPASSAPASSSAVAGGAGFLFGASAPA